MFLICILYTLSTYIFIKELHDESLKLNEINHHYTMLIYFSFLDSKVKI